MSDAPAPPEALTAIEVADAPAFRAAMSATEAQMGDLQAYLGILADWNHRMNLVGPSALDQFWPRHAWDSAQLLRHAPDARTFADLGAGAGFPGLILAILLKGTPRAHVHLVESMAKRCRFLNEVVRALVLPATVHNARAEDLDLTVDIVTARACAPLPRLLSYARPYLRRGATAMFLKGQDVVAELDEATKSWKFHSHLRPSLSNPSGHILVVEGAVRER